MRPAKFEYQRAASLGEAVKLLSNNDGAKALAGGHSLLPAMSLRLNQPDALVDIGRLDELKGISVTNNILTLGALSTHAQIAGSSDVRNHAPALATACGLVGDPQVRNWGTIGGNVAHADPASDPPTVLVAYGASIHTHGVGGSRSINAEDYFIDLFTTDLQEGELISTIEIPGSGDKKSAYTKLAHPASRYAVVGVCVVLEMDGATCSGARVAVGGATPKATRSQAAEAALAGTSLDDRALDAAANALLDDIGDELLSDIYASEAYRKAMAGVYLKRAVRSALG